MKTESLLEGNVYKALIRFAVPFMLASLLQALYGATDLLVVGHFATTADVSAVSIGSQVMMLLTQVVLGVTTGVTVLLGQYFGAKQEKELAKTVGTAVVLFSFIAVFLTAAVLLLKDLIIFWMHTPAQAVAAASDYLFYCSCGILFIVGYNVVCSILRGLGDSKTPLIFVAVACVVNIVMDLVLVAVFGMGAGGAAIATAFAQGLSFLFSIFYLRKKGLGFPFHKSSIKIYSPQLRGILRLGFPIALQSALVSVSFLLIMVIINEMGLVSSAAVGVVEKIIEFLFIPATAMGAAVAAMSAQNFGAGKLHRAKKCMLGGVCFSAIFGVVVCLYCQFAGETVTGLFTNESEVVAAAALYLRTYSVDCIVCGFVFSMNGYFNGCGNPLFTMFHSLATTFFVRIPLSFFLSRLASVSLLTMGIAAPVSTLVSLIICAAYLVRMNRKTGKRLPENPTVNII